MTKKIPKVSIIMNCHNGEKYLKYSLRSLRQQIYSNWELIFFDNNSNDRSKKIFKTYKDKRFKYFFSPKYLSLYHARNLALEKARGKYLSFLDVDDTWFKEKIKIQIDKAEQTKTDFIYSNYNILKKNITSIAFHRKKPEGFIDNDLLKHYFIPILTVFFKRKLLKKNNLRFDKEFNIIGDFDLFYKLSKKTSFSYIHKPLATYRVHSKNFSILNTNLYIQEYNIWLKKNKKELTNLSIKKMKILILYLTIKTYIFTSKYKLAIKNFIKYPLSLNKLKLLALFIVPKKFFNF